MAYVEWEIKAREFANCNCAYGCPCQFNALPTHGHCRAVGAFAIDEGYFGDIRLDGLRAVNMGKWPGPVHEGGGTWQAIIDQRANEAQRAALAKILYGQETEPGATMWNIFTSMSSTVLDPLYAEIQFEVDIERRHAHLVVPGLIEGKGEPIRNPVTGGESRARIDIVDGFEFTIAEMGSGTSKVTGAVAMDLVASYGQFAHIHLSTHGIVR